MPYTVALEKAWKDLEMISSSDKYNVSLLVDTYDLDIKERKIFSNSCNIPAREYLAILILHYLIGSLKNTYVPSGEWISFKQIEGGETYYQAFHKGVIEPLLRKYGKHPEGIFSALERFRGEKVDVSDTAIEIITFPEIKVRIILYQGDEEFEPEANILFDRGLTKIYSMEDITVFFHFIVGSI